MDGCLLDAATGVRSVCLMRHAPCLEEDTEILIDDASMQGLRGPKPCHLHTALSQAPSLALRGKKDKVDSVEPRTLRKSQRSWQRSVRSCSQAEVPNRIAWLSFCSKLRTPPTKDEVTCCPPMQGLRKSKPCHLHAALRQTPSPALRGTRAKSTVWSRVLCANHKRAGSAACAAVRKRKCQTGSRYEVTCCTQHVRSCRAAQRAGPVHHEREQAKRA